MQRDNEETFRIDLSKKTGPEILAYLNALLQLRHDLKSQGKLLKIRKKNTVVNRKCLS